MYRVIKHRRPNGRCPLDDYLEGLRKAGRAKDIAKIEAIITKLAELGPRLKITDLTKQIEDDLWELIPKPHRIFYYWNETGKAYVLLNAFWKKTQRTPRNEINLALSLMNEHKGGLR